MCELVSASRSALLPESHSCGLAMFGGKAMKKKKLIGIGLLVVLAVALLVLLPARAHAAVAVDEKRPASLELTFTLQGAPAQGVAFSAYRVADMRFTGELTPTQSFAEYSLSFDNATAESWAAMAGSLNEVVFADGIVPDAKAVTDAQGVATLSGLPVGLYLIVGEAFRVDGADAVPAPFMICLPSLSADDEWMYDAQSNVKHEVLPDASSSTKPGQGKLAQTGQLWWSLPLLLAAGMLLGACGAVLLRAYR